MADKMVAGQWKQLREKFQAVTEEANKWTQIRSTLMTSIGIFLETISNSQTNWQESHAE
jgi:hypothetical protein